MAAPSAPSAIVIMMFRRLISGTLDNISRTLRTGLATPWATARLVLTHPRPHAVRPRLADCAHGTDNYAWKPDQHRRRSACRRISRPGLHTDRIRSGTGEQRPVQRYARAAE